MQARLKAEVRPFNSPQYNNLTVVLDKSTSNFCKQNNVNIVIAEQSMSKINDLKVLLDVFVVSVRLGEQCQ